MAATAPTFITTPTIGSSVVSTANTNRDGTGTTPTVFTAGASGALLEAIVFTADGNTTQGALRIFAEDGVATRIIDEVNVPARTVDVSNGIHAWHHVWKPPYHFLVKATETVQVSTHNAETFYAVAVGGDF